MESHEVIRQACSKLGAKQVASDLGVSLSLVYKWSEPSKEQGNGSGSLNPLDRVVCLMESTRSRRIIEWLCERAGGYYVRNPESSCAQGFEVYPATNEIVRQFGALLTEISQAALDNSITDDEATRIRQVWDALKSYAEGFVRCCEEGDFDRIRNTRIEDMN